MIARYKGTCILCEQPIKQGQLIEGEKRAYFHSNCDEPDEGGQFTEEQRFENPNAPASEGQLRLIVTLLTERKVTMAVAGRIIDQLKLLPKNKSYQGRR